MAMEPDTTPWRSFFEKLASLRSLIVPYWTMANGADFWMAIPATHEIENNSFAEQVEFPFTFDEILSLRIDRRHGPIENDIESISRAISEIDGLSIAQGEDRIEITCDAE